MAQSAENPWALAAHVGFSGYHGDMGDNLFYQFNTEKSTYGLSLSRYISHYFDALVQANYTNWAFTENAQNHFDGNFYSYGVRVHLKLNNGKFLKEDAIIAPYFVAGAAAMFATSDKITNGRTSAPAWELGYGLKIKLTKSFHLQLQSIYGITPNDEIDGIRNGSGDRYALHTVGLVYSFHIHSKKDSDGDGVADWKDKCPNTALGVKVDATGCPADSDGDGVPDFFDHCPTVKGTIANHGCPESVDTDGDGITDDQDYCPNEKGSVALHGCPDTDGDGVPDYMDKCPTVKGTAANKGCPEEVDSDGDGVVDSKDKCPHEKGLASMQGCPDTDGDGVADNDDQCPNVKGVKENHGCPPIKVEDQKKLDLLIHNINFQTGSDVILAASNVSLAKVVEVLKANPTYKLEIGGHTDNVGSAKNNMELSDKRDNAVKNYLVKKGIDTSRLKAIGYGDTVPLVPNTTTQNKAKNRRVEMKLK